MLDLARPTFGLDTDSDAERLSRLSRHCFGMRSANLPLVRSAGEALLAILNEMQARRSCRIIVSGGESPSLVGEVAATAGRQGHDLILIPPTHEGLADEPSLHRALHSDRSDKKTFFLCGTTSAYGIKAPLERWAGYCRRVGAELILDMTPSILSEQVIPPLTGVAGVVAEIQPSGDNPLRWAFHRPNAEIFGASGGDDSLAKIAALGQELRSALAMIPLVEIPSKRYDARPLPYAPGLVVFEIEGWSAKEACALLDECFGLEIDPGPLSAVPLPSPANPAKKGDPLRVILRPEHEHSDIAFLAEAVARLAATDPGSRVVH